MAVVVEVDCAVGAGKSKVIALEAPLNGLRVFSELGLWAETVAVASTVLSTQSPTNLGRGTSLPVCWFSCWKDLRTIVACRVTHGHLSTRSGVTETTCLTARVIDGGLARCTPRVVLCEVATSGVTMGVPSAELWII